MICLRLPQSTGRLSNTGTALMLLAAALPLGACAASTPQSDAQPTVTQTVTVPAETSTEVPGSTDATAAKVPNIVGTRLSDAESRLTAAGFVNVVAKDASPADRVVMNPENWIVKAQSPAGGASSATSSEVTVQVLKPSDDQGSSVTTQGVVPNVVCKDLQTAQDTMQAAGFYDLGSEDGSGQGRAQLVDRNWVVTKQSVPAGSRPGDVRVVLTAVKFGEPTGASGCRD